MRTRRLLLAPVLVFVSAALSAAQDPPLPDQPTFRATTERVVIDAAVVDQAGRPITDVTASEFQLNVDGKPRGIVSVEFIPHLSEPAAPTPQGGLEAFSTNERVQAGRLVLLAIDQNTITIGRGLYGIHFGDVAPRSFDARGSRRRHCVSARPAARVHDRSQGGRQHAATGDRNGAAHDERGAAQPNRGSLPESR